MFITEQRKIFRYNLKTQWILLAIALVIIGIINYLYISRHYDQTFQQERDRLRNLALATDKNITYHIESINQVLHHIQKELMTAPHRNDFRQLSSRLKILCDAMTGVRTIIIADASGNILGANRDDLRGLNVRQRVYFGAASENPDPAKLYISEPFLTFTGVYVMNLTRVITGPRGEFSGIITAALDPEYFKIVMSSVLYAPDMWSAIAHGGGIQFFMVPDRLGQTGKNLAQPGSFFSRHLESGLSENIFTGRTYATDEDRFMLIRTIFSRIFI